MNSKGSSDLIICDFESYSKEILSQRSCLKNIGSSVNMKACPNGVFVGGNSSGSHSVGENILKAVD